MALFKFNLKHQDCIDSHKSFYNEDFEVLPMRRRNYFDIFPLNLLIAYIDPPGSGEWDGIISTNGKKIVMTEGKMLNLAKHKKVYEFNLDEIKDHQLQRKHHLQLKAPSSSSNSNGGQTQENQVR